MLLFLEHLILTAALLLLVANLVRGVHVQGWSSAFIGAIVLGFVNCATAYATPHVAFHDS
jgi:putative membrane protein